MEPLSREKISELVQHELKSLSESDKIFILKKLISPKQKTLIWEYGNDEECEAWVFAYMNEQNIALVYCLGGFGELGSPWGLIFNDSNNFGMDAGWYRTLEELINEWLN